MLSVEWLCCRFRSPDGRLATETADDGAQAADHFAGRADGASQGASALAPQPAAQSLATLRALAGLHPAARAVPQARAGLGATARGRGSADSTSVQNPAHASPSVHARGIDDTGAESPADHS